MQQEEKVTKPDGPSQAGRNRNLWIVAGVVLVLACACVAVVAALVGGSLLIYTREARAVPDFGREATVERVVSVSPGTRLVVDNFAGSIDMEPTEGNQIHVVAVKHGASGLDLNRVEVNVEQRGDTVVVHTDRPMGLGNVYVNLQISAPRGTPLDLSNGSGSVGVQGFHAGVTVETGSGSIVARGLVGDVALNTGSGAIDVQDVEGSVALDSGSGSFALQGINGDIDAHTGSGGIDVLDASGNTRLETGSGTVEYQGAPKGECRFETGSGSVILHLPAELGFLIRADTGSGSVDVQFQVEGRVSRQHVEGVVGTGQEATIIASTGSGAIDVFPY